MGEPLRDQLAAASLKVRYKYASTDEFIRESSNDISSFGIFIRTKSPLKEGVPLMLELQLKDGSPVIRGLGIVDWRREIALSEDRPSGMGIKFLKLDDISREVVERAVEARGVAPSRFNTNRLKQVVARATSERQEPFPRLECTLSGIPVPVPLNSDNPSSLSPGSDASNSGSWPFTSGPRRHSFTRVKTLSVSYQSEEPSAWSGEHPEKVEPAVNSSPSERQEEAQPPVAQVAAVAEAPIGAERDIQPGAQSPPVDGNRASVLPPAPTFTQDMPQGDAKRIRTISSVLSAMAKRGDTGTTVHGFDTPAAQLPVTPSSPPAWPNPAAVKPSSPPAWPNPAAVKPSSPPAWPNPTAVKSSSPPAWPNLAPSAREARQAPPLRPVHDLSDRGPTILSPLPRAGESQGEGAKTESAAAASISPTPRERTYSDQPILVPERTQAISLRERLAIRAASEPSPALSDHESAHRLKRLAELSEAEIRQYTIARPLLLLKKLFLLDR